MGFKIKNIVDSNTIEVQGWEWREYKGKYVRIYGYSSNTVDPEKRAFAKKKLEILLTDKEVELKNVINVEKNPSGDDIIVCSVFLNDVNIVLYFPELTTTAS